MVGSGDELAAGAAGHSYLRASNADREQVIDTLKAAFVRGRLTKDEFDGRVAQTFASRTYADLEALTTDIQTGHAAALQPPRPAPAARDAVVDANGRRCERAMIATALLASLAFIAAFFTGEPLAPLLALGALGSALVSMLLAGIQVHSSRGDKRPRIQPPSRRTMSAGPGAGRQAAPATPSGQLPAPKRRRPGKTDAGRSHLPSPQLSS